MVTRHDLQAKMNRLWLTAVIGSVCAHTWPETQSRISVKERRCYIVSGRREGKGNRAGREFRNWTGALQQINVSRLADNREQSGCSHRERRHLYGWGSFVFRTIQERYDTSTVKTACDSSCHKLDQYDANGHGGSRRTNVHSVHGKSQE
jgi:hypothetical protein